MKVFTFIIGLLAIGVFIGSAIIPASAQVCHVVSDKAHWTCYDFSTDYAKNNQGWGIVTISYNCLFKGVSHTVNYRIGENNSLIIHDGLYNTDYTLYDWESVYYCHFWINKIPVRNYMFLQDNKGEILNENS